MSKRKATKKAAKKAPAKSKRKAKPRAPQPPVVAPKAPPTPQWGPPKVVGNIGNRQVTIREPLNQAAIDSLTEQEAMALVLAVLVGRLDANMSEVGRLLGSLKGWAGTEALREANG